jgi:hypothetical protein
MLSRYKRRILAAVGVLAWLLLLVALIINSKADHLTAILAYIGGGVIILASVIVLNFNYMLYSYIFSKSLQRDNRRGIFFVSYRKNQVRFLKSGFNPGVKMTIQEFGNTYLGLNNPLGGEVAAALGELDTNLYKKPLVKVKTVVGVKYYSIYCLKRYYKGVICMIIDETITGEYN